MTSKSMPIHSIKPIKPKHKRAKKPRWIPVAPMGKLAGIIQKRHFKRLTTNGRGYVISNRPTFGATGS